MISNIWKPNVLSITDVWVGWTLADFRLVYEANGP